jgi:pyruvate dehydrogenase E2 component (dihydrolipoamide acetyltransferase)
VPLTGVRRAVAETLTRSRREIPEATTWVDVDATALLEFRAALDDGRPRPGLLAVVARFAVAGLAAFPALNSRVDSDRGEVVELDGVNLGIAAQTDRGLVVPAVRDAHRLGMRALDAEIRRLTAGRPRRPRHRRRADRRLVHPEQLRRARRRRQRGDHQPPGGRDPGMGRIIPRPWVVDGEIVPRGSPSCRWSSTTASATAAPPAGSCGSSPTPSRTRCPPWPTSERRADALRRARRVDR